MPGVELGTDAALIFAGGMAAVTFGMAAASAIRTRSEDRRVTRQINNFLEKVNAGPEPLDRGQLAMLLGVMPIHLYRGQTQELLDIAMDKTMDRMVQAAK